MCVPFRAKWVCMQDKKNSRCRKAQPLLRIGLCVLLGAAWIGPRAAQAQLASDTAQVATLTGTVSVERAGELWTLTSGQTLQAGQAIVTGADGYAQLSLPDDSVLEVFPDSRLIFRANRVNWRDLLDLYLGKVRLQIQHLTSDAPPLRVTSPTAVISVRGTVFDVEVDAAQQTIISVENGTVSVRHRLLPGNEVFVESGQTLRVAPTLPLTPVDKGLVGPLGTLGRVVRAVGDTWARVNAARGSSGSHPSTQGSSPSASPAPGSGPASQPPPSDSGSNETAPPPGDDNDKHDAPPGDVIP